MILTKRMAEAALRLLDILIYMHEGCVCVCKEGNGGRPSTQVQK